METEALVGRLVDRVHEARAEPVAHVVVEEVWLAVVEGTLEIGQRLPTARELAIALGASPRTIERAYAELERRGVAVTRRGSGTFVNLTQPSEEDRVRHRELAKLCRETVQRATELGFEIDDVIDALGDFASAAQDSSARDPGS